jgi:release factor glutamine methyltransferase
VSYPVESPDFNHEDYPLNTIRDAMNAARERLSSSETARLEAQTLLCHVLHVNSAYLYGYPEQELTPEQEAAFTALVERRAAGEPLAYILGTVGFYDLEFDVTPAVLIPRPETEHLVEEALNFAAQKSTLIAADIGTGSGAIAVTVAVHAPHAVVHAVDISPEALTIARKNAELNHANVIFHQGSLAEPLVAAGIHVDLLMANLPYIASAEVPTLEVSKHEPVLALDGGMDGLRLIERLLETVPQVCHPGAMILLEIGAYQGEAALNIVRKLLPDVSAAILKDYAGHDRIVRLVL